jgi:tetratricopeptide (TPR) repeat protein
LALHDLTFGRANYTYDPDTSPIVEAKQRFRDTVASADELNPVERSMRHVNYGNCLSRLGRTVEAIDQYVLAIAIAPDHAMAWGNLGIELEYYANVASDPSHLYNARDALTQALEGEQLERTAHYGSRAECETVLERVMQRLDSNRLTMPPIHATQTAHRTLYHEHYAQFCTQHRRK